MKDLKTVPAVNAGDVLVHKVWGCGVIESVDRSTLTVKFPEAGIKTLGLQWCIETCEIRKS